MILSSECETGDQEHICTECEVMEMMGAENLSMLCVFVLDFYFQALIVSRDIALRDPDYFFPIQVTG